MAASLKGASWATNTDGASLSLPVGTPTTGSGPSEGDLMVILAGHDINATTWSGLTGWTVVSPNPFVTNTACSGLLAYKIAGASESDVTLASNTSGDDAVALLLIIDGGGDEITVDAASIIDDNATTNPRSTGSQTVVAGAGNVGFAIAMWLNDSLANITTAPSGLGSVLIELEDASGSLTMAVYDAYDLSAGAINPSLEWSVTDQNVAAILVGHAGSAGETASATDNAEASDSATAAATYAVSVSDNAVASEGMATTVSTPATPEGAVASDTVTASATLAASASDSAEASDSASSEIVAVVELVSTSDNGVASDAASASASLTVSASDSAVASDAPSIQTALAALVADGAVASDAATAAGTVHGLATDIAVATDFASLAATLRVSAGDSAVASDNTLGSAGSGEKLLCSALPSLVLLYEQAASTGGSAAYSGKDEGNAQSFTTGASGAILEAACARVNRNTGSPTGNFIAKLYASTGTPGSSAKPTGAALATSENAVDLSLLGSAEWVAFTFASVVLSGGTTYCIAIELDGAGLTDISNRPAVWSAAGDPDPTQNFSASNDLVTWTAVASRDMDIRVYVADLLTPAARDIHGRTRRINIMGRT